MPPSLEISLCLSYVVIGPLSCFHSLVESTWVKHSCLLVCFSASLGFSHQCIPITSPGPDSHWLWDEMGFPLRPVINGHCRELGTEGMLSFPI